MLTKAEILARRDEILAIARKHGASDVRIFGSVARGDANEQSDLDIVVRFERGRTLMDHAALVGELSDLFGVRVDVVDADGMRPRFRALVEREMVAL